ncbi:MAG: hypothetical protein ACE145_18180 [Terriglobia bacterium]
MEKHLINYTHWLGVAAAAVALVWRVLIIAGVPEKVLGLSYMTAYKGALIFFLAAIATASCVWIKGQKT